GGGGGVGWGGGVFCGVGVFGGGFWVVVLFCCGCGCWVGGCWLLGLCWGWWWLGCLVLCGVALVLVVGGVGFGVGGVVVWGGGGGWSGVGGFGVWRVCVVVCRLAF
ncbi:hypothetical protein RA266_27830, partial [Pseudomonas syringae pv. tagetis]|uniref:hypothetical protein n=1 Tax=Pseudomonas syringae group genomosp. 7 TaxID=251699 RepID=UPI0037701FD6